MRTNIPDKLENALVDYLYLQDYAGLLNLLDFLKIYCVQSAEDIQNLGTTRDVDFKFYDKAATIIYKAYTQISNSL